MPSVRRHGAMPCVGRTSRPLDRSPVRGLDRGLGGGAPAGTSRPRWRRTCAARSPAGGFAPVRGGVRVRARGRAGVAGVRERARGRSPAGGFAPVCGIQRGERRDATGCVACYGGARVDEKRPRALWRRHGLPSPVRGHRAQGLWGLWGPVSPGRARPCVEGHHRTSRIRTARSASQPCCAASRGSWVRERPGGRGGGEGVSQESWVGGREGAARG